MYDFKLSERKGLFLKLAIAYVIVIIFVKVIYRLNDPYHFRSAIMLENWWQSGINLNIFSSIPDKLSLYTQGPVFFKNALFTMPLGFFLEGAKINKKIFWTVSTLTIIGTELAQFVLMVGSFDVGTVFVMVLGCIIGSMAFSFICSRQ